MRRNMGGLRGKGYPHTLVGPSTVTAKMSKLFAP